MVINDVVDGISIKVNGLLGNEYKINTNSVIQGFNSNSVFIKQLPSERIQVVGNRYKNKLSFVLHVFTKSNSDDELNNTADRLYNLEFITLLDNNVLRGTNLRHQIQDSVLLFFVDYEFFTHKETIEEIKMEEISLDEEVKHEE